jgi:hypothetical protein
MIAANSSYSLDGIEGTPFDAKLEHLRPLTQAWIGKIEASERSRASWKAMADECMMFYSKSAAAMWSPNYEKKFWKNVQAPKFRISINKAFEVVAVMGPSLMWEVPHRQVSPKRRYGLPDEIFRVDPQAQAMEEQFRRQEMERDAIDQTTATLLSEWLNFTPREQPMGGLIRESELAIVDALIKGRGCMVTRPFQFPGDDRTYTGSFRVAPEDVYLDPDARQPSEAKWIAIKHAEPYWMVERRFGYKKNQLRGRATLESHWSTGERSAFPDQAGQYRASGQTSDILIWYEIYSKMGCGANMSGVDPKIASELERTVGDYAYVAISPSVPHPLNCHHHRMYDNSSKQIAEKFKWPVEYWRDDDFPIEFLDFYPNTDETDPAQAWPIPLLAPAMGELKFLNFLVPWLANRVWTTSRDFWAVAQGHVSHYKKYLQEGGDLTVIPTPMQADDVRKVIQRIEHAETRMDVWRIIELVSQMFDKRTGLTEFMYGRNEGGTQNRTAEETIAKKQAVNIRPDHMQKKVVGWQSRLAAKEAYAARGFVRPKDVAPLLGQAGAYFWGKYVNNDDPNAVFRQLSYDVAASSIRRPNRERDVANFNQAMQFFTSFVQQYTQATGNWEVVNALLTQWGDLHDMDLRSMHFQPPEPDPQQQQMQQMQMQAEMQKLQADVQKAQAGMQKAQIDAQAKQQQAEAQAVMAKLNMAAKQQGVQVDVQKAQMAMQLEQQKSQMGLQSEMQKRQIAAQADMQKMQSNAQSKAMDAHTKMQLDMASHIQELEQDQTRHLMDMLQDRQRHELDMQQKIELAAMQQAEALARKADQRISNSAAEAN